MQERSGVIQPSFRCNRLTTIMNFCFCIEIDEDKYQSSSSLPGSRLARNEAVAPVKPPSCEIKPRISSRSDRISTLINARAYMHRNRKPIMYALSHQSQSGRYQYGLADVLLL